MFFVSRPLVLQIVHTLSKKGLTLSSSESLTGGLFASGLVSVPGASRVFWGGVVVYSPEAKLILSGVDAQIVSEFGLVSREVSEAMALGILAVSSSDISISLTGVAGPGPDVDAVSAGTVWISCAMRNAEQQQTLYSCCYQFNGSRNSIRKKAVLYACKMVLQRLKCVDTN